MAGPFDPSPDEVAFSAAARKRAAALMAGEGVPTGDELYAGMTPGIEGAVSGDARSAADDYASRGLSSSGMQAGSIAGSYRDRARKLAAARMSADQSSRQMGNTAWSQGAGMMMGLDDRDQRRKMLEYGQKSADWQEQQNAPFLSKMGQSFQKRRGLGDSLSSSMGWTDPGALPF